MAIHNLRRLNSRPVTIQNATLYFHLLSWNFFFQKKTAIIFISFFFDEVSNFRNRILTNQKQEYVMKNCQWNCT